jgi:hypothetical protein
MTPEEWATCTDPRKVLAFLLKHGASERKLRLFAVACCRGTGPPVHQDDVRGTEVEERLWRALRLAEQFADGSPEATAADLFMAYVTTDFRFELPGPLVLAYHATADTSAWDAAFGTVRCLDDSYWEEDETYYGTACLRDIFGNPCRPATFDPPWRTETAVSLERQMYENRNFSLMPIMGDALADAGCPDGDVLEHCRGQGPHVRGCHVVDLVLNRSGAARSS